MSTNDCSLCDKPMDYGEATSRYVPWTEHADRRICVERIRADERSRLIEAVRARCIRDKHRDRHYTPSSWYVCVQCTPFVKILKGELS